MPHYSNNTTNGQPHWQFDPSKSNVGLPKKLRCDGCNKVKNQNDFSNVTLKKVVDMVRKNKNLNFEHTGRVTCSHCKPGNREELECSSCDKTKPLESFSKQQRRRKDQAVCTRCQAPEDSGQKGNSESSADDDEAGEGDLPKPDMDGSSTDRDGWELQPGRGFPRSTTSKKTTTIAQSSSRSSAGSVSGASNAAGPAQSVAGRSPIDNAARNGQPTMQSSTSTSGRGNLNTSNAQAKLDMGTGSGSEPDSDASSYDGEF